MPVSSLQAAVRGPRQILRFAACSAAFAAASALITTRALPWWVQLGSLALLGLGCVAAYGKTRTSRPPIVVSNPESERARSTELPPNEALRTLFDQSSLGLTLLTRRGWILRLNPRAEALLEQREAGLIGCLFAKNPCWSEAQRELLQAAVEDAACGNACQHELTLTNGGGRPLVLQVTLSPCLDQDDCITSVLVELYDLTDFVETRNMLAQARRLEALGKLSGGVAHDLNNMFAAIMGGCELIRLARGDATRIESNRLLIQRSVERAAALTRQLLLFGRKESSKRERLDANQLLGDVTRLLERTLHKNLELVVSASDAPCYVQADAAAIEHALLNLALNAQDATSHGGTITLACRPSVLQATACERMRGELEPGPCVILSVSDTGIGMSADVKERMFEPFFTTKAAGHGTGLGLAAVHATMRAHRGGVEVNSELGIGTRIELVFPALDPVAQSSVAKEPEVALPDRIDAEILLADDEALTRAAIAGMLEVAGCKVRAVANGAALIEALAEQDGPDLIVTDLAMPSVGGLHLIETLEVLRPSCPLLLITGHAADSIGPVDLTRPGRRLLHKPFTNADLIGAISELLKPHHPPAALPEVL